MKKEFEKLGPLFTRLVEIVARLRAPDGCPWDREQTPQTLKKYLLEEAYEVVEAIDKDQPLEVCEEIGDALFLLVFLGYLYEEEGKFRLADMLTLCAEKMIRRHPHVFGERNLESPEEVVRQWQRIKEKEAQKKGLSSSVLGNLPRNLPALQRAFRVGERASRVGFDWKRPEDLFDKLDEEIEELKEALKKGLSSQIKEELGDLLFTIVNLSRKLGINPEEALKETTEKFISRFVAMEKKIQGQGQDLRELSLEEMDQIWEEVKQKACPKET